MFVQGYFLGVRLREPWKVEDPVDLEEALPAGVWMEKGESMPALILSSVARQDEQLFD
jgi:hypothetical protein